MFPGCLQDFSRMFSGCSDGSYWPGGIWWSFQMKVWTLKIQRNPMIPNYSMIPAAAIRWSPAIRWSIRSMDFDNRKVYGDTSITDGLVICVQMCSFVFKLVQNLFKCVQMWPNLFKTHSNVLKCVQTCSELVQMCSFHIRSNLFKTFSNVMYQGYNST